MRKGQEIEIVAGKAVYGGKCLSKVDDKTVFLERALPNERVMAKIFKKRKNYLEARATQILEPSVHRRTVECEYYLSCGGCK